MHFGDLRVIGALVGLVIQDEIDAARLQRVIDTLVERRDIEIRCAPAGSGI